MCSWSVNSVHRGGLDVTVPQNLATQLPAERSTPDLIHHLPATQVQPDQQLRTSSDQRPHLAVLPLRGPGGLGHEAANVILER